MLTEVQDALPTLLGSVEFLRTQPGSVPGGIVLTIFLALASLDPHDDHKLPLATFREVSQSVAMVFKLNHQNIRLLRHATGDQTQGSYLIWGLHVV